MQFTLTYRGPLKANGPPKHKMEIRRHFHRQLGVLWQQLPVSDVAKFMVDESSPSCVLSSLGLFTFAPLVSSKVHLFAEIDVFLLRPGPPGQLLAQGGDIDNRLKTLLDSLTMPPHENQIPTGDAPAADERPFYCLLEDDALVSRVAVSTDRMLEPQRDQSEVIAQIGVRIRATRATGITLGFI